MSNAKLDADAQRRLEALRAVLGEAEAARWASLCPTAEQDAAAKADDADRARQRAAAERDALEDLADAAAAGSYGPAGAALAQRIFATGGRCPHNLRALRDAIRQLSPRARRRVATEPTPAGAVKAAFGTRR